MNKGDKICNSKLKIDCEQSATYIFFWSKCKFPVDDQVRLELELLVALF